MTGRKRCNDCGGTGKESCEVHGSHTCSKCQGKGCIDKAEFSFINPPLYKACKVNT